MGDLDPTQEFRTFDLVAANPGAYSKDTLIEKFREGNLVIAYALLEGGVQAEQSLRHYKDQVENIGDELARLATHKG